MRTTEGSSSTETWWWPGWSGRGPQGKRIGRPRVNERPEFEQRFAVVVQHIGPGGLARNQAAPELGIGYATLKRLLKACGQASDNTQLS